MGDRHGKFPASQPTGPQHAGGPGRIGPYWPGGGEAEKCQAEGGLGTEGEIVS